MCYCPPVKPFASGCFAGLCLVLGFLAAFKGGMLAYEGDWAGLVAGASVSACYLIGAGLVIRKVWE